jgi:hypothetical protein
MLKLPVYWEGISNILACFHYAVFKVHSIILLLQFCMCQFLPMNHEFNLLVFVTVVESCCYGL